MSAFDSYVQAAYHGSTIPGGPTFTVVHDAETPLARGYADSIASFFQRGPTAGTSAHAMVGPEKAIKMLPDNVVAWAAGPMANTYGWHMEQAGYASFTRADWTTPDGLAQIQRAAACLREIHNTWGIPKRWVTDAQLRAAAKGDRSQGGITTHQQIARVLGGTFHHDPEVNYPTDLLLRAVLGTPTPPPPPEDPDMAFTDTQAAQLQLIVDLLTPGKAGVKSAGDVWTKVNNASAGVSALLARSTDIDPNKLATAIVDSMPDDLARKVADELGKRLNTPA